MKYVSHIKILFQKHYDELTGYVLHKFGDNADAEDIVQDTFHNILRLPDSEHIENPRAYLYKTAYNLALNRVRKNKNHDIYLLPVDSTVQAVSVEKEVFAQRDIESLQNRINELPKKTRDIFLMSRIEEKKNKEISEELGISLSSVEKHIRMALDFTSECLEFDE